MTEARVICTSTHAVDLSDGRTLAPGEEAEGVDTDHEHQRALVLDGHILVLEGMKPRVRQKASQGDDDEGAPATIAGPAPSTEKKEK